MLIIILLPLLTNCLKNKAKCQTDSTTQICDHLTIYFNPTYPIRINSLIQFILPFELQGQETLEISSFDESSVPSFSLNGDNYFMLTQILPENVWYKCNLTLTTAYSVNAKGIGQFQMNIVASKLSNTLILEKGEQFPLSYSIVNQIYIPITTTPLSPVIPLTVGTACTVSDWGSPIVKNSVRQYQTMTFSLSADTTNDRLDIVLTLDGLGSGMIFHKECQMSSTDVTKYQTNCLLQQKGLVLTFQLRSDNPILLTASTQYLIEFYVSHQADTITANTFTAQMFHGTQLIDQCSSSKTFLIDESDSSTISKQITEVKIYLDTPNIGVSSFFGVSFQPKSIQQDTLIRIELGFLTYNQLFCQVYQQELNLLVPSLSFSHYSSDSSNLYFYSNKYKTDNSPYLYTINCTGIYIKQIVNQMFRIAYEDLYHTVIQFFQMRQPPKLPSSSSVTASTLNIVKYIQLLNKQFNSPLFASNITFQIQPIFGIMRVLIEFPNSYGTNVIKCVLNQTETYCRQDKFNPNRLIIYLLKYENSALITQQFTLTIYGMVNPQKLIYNSKILVMLDNDDIMEPLLFDNQNDLNGIMYYEYIDDYINDNNNYNYLETVDFKFSQSFARLYDVYLRGNITFQMNSIKEENILYLRISNQYNIYNLNCQLNKIGDSQLNNYVSSCNIFQNYIKMTLVDDTGNQRFSQQYFLNISAFRTSDLILSDTMANLQPMIQVFLVKDDTVLFFENQVSGSFILKTNKIPLYWYNLDEDGNYQRLEAQPGFEETPKYIIYLNYFTDKRLFLGLGDVSDRFNCTVNLQLPQIHQDIILFGQSSKYSKQSFSSQAVTQPKYMVTSITDDAHFETIQDTDLIINPGDSGFIFNIASKKLINIQFKVQINYTITFPDRNSWNPIYYYNPYTEIPLLYLEIENIDCELVPQKSSYDLPLNGYTLPIIVDPQGCIPVIDKKLNVTIDDNNGLELVPIQLTLSRYRYELITRTTKKALEYTYLFQIKSTNTTKEGITTQVIINNLAITITTIPQYEEQPNITALVGTYSESSNAITLTMSCSQPSEIILVIGIDEISDDSFKILQNNDVSKQIVGDYDLFKIEPQNATLLQESSHLYRYEIQPTALIMDIYNNKIGNTIQYFEYDIVSQVNQSLINDNSYKTLMNSMRRMMIARMSLIDKTSQLHLRRVQTKINFFDSPQTFLLTNLKYQDKYSFGYYCKNQNGNASDLSTNFLYISNSTKLNNNTKGNMLQLKFKEKITSLQENNILCAFAQFFSINYYQVLSKQCKQCRFSNIHYDKINYSDYQQLIQDYIPYENRSTTDKQKFLDNLYTMTLYFNNYPSSNGQDFDIKQKIDKQMNLTNDTMLNILNITDDLKLTFLYESFTYTELKPEKRSENDLTTQVVLLGYEFKTISMDITIKANYDVLAFVGLHKIEPIYENVIKHPTGIMLRRGILGTFSNISEGVQYQELSKGENTTLTFKNLEDGQKYLIYYSSSDLQNDCLTKQYQETVVLQITYIAAQQSLEILFKLFCIMVYGLISF